MKSDGKQNCLCGCCGRQFPKPSEYSQNGRNAETVRLIARSLVREVGEPRYTGDPPGELAVIYRIIDGLKNSHVPLRRHYGPLDRAVLALRLYDFRSIYFGCGKPMEHCV